LAVVGAGAETLIPVGKFHRARVRPQIPVPGGGALLTVSAAVAECVVSVVPTNRWFVVLVSVPVAVGVTLTEMTQVPFAPIVPLEKEIELAPAFAVSVGVPQPDVVAPLGFATTRLAGRLSTKLYPLSAPPFGFVSVIVSAEMPFTLAGFGLKLFEIVEVVGSMRFAKTAPVEKSAL
jgi:hypothetical protein